jgi:hypothetical protein
VNTIHKLVLGLSIFTVAACASDDPLSAPVASTPSLNEDLSGSALSIAAAVRVRCEVRSGRRSRISVDGNNLTPLNGRFSALVRSGTNLAAAPAQTAIGDEVEFDFDSNPANIAAGATPIAVNFIQVMAGPDVSARILNAAGNIVATGSADCTVR